MFYTKTSLDQVQIKNHCAYTSQIWTGLMYRPLTLPLSAESEAGESEANFSVVFETKVLAVSVSDCSVEPEAIAQQGKGQHEKLMQPSSPLFRSHHVHVLTMVDTENQLKLGYTLCPASLIVSPWTRTWSIISLDFSTLCLPLRLPLLLSCLLFLLLPSSHIVSSIHSQTLIPTFNNLFAL